jgi:sec-independent protein translocase protein TatA
MPFIGGGHMWLVLVVLVVVLILWGPGKLPDVGSGLGRAIREFRRTSTESHDEPPSAPQPPPLL